MAAHLPDQNIHVYIVQCRSNDRTPFGFKQYSNIIPGTSRHTLPGLSGSIETEKKNESLLL